jgi:hypothetical protein
VAVAWFKLLLLLLVLVLVLLLLLLLLLQMPESTMEAWRTDVSCLACRCFKPSNGIVTTATLWPHHALTPHPPLSPHQPPPQRCLGAAAASQGRSTCVR